LTVLFAIVTRPGFVDFTLASLGAIHGDVIAVRLFLPFHGAVASSAVRMTALNTLPVFWSVVCMPGARNAIRSAPRSRDICCDSLI
jgi:hypothetical protein